MIEEYDLPVESKEPPYINTTLLQCAVACSSPPDEVQKILVHFYNLYDKNNFGKTVFDLPKDQPGTLELLEQRQQELGFKMLYSLDSVLMKQYPAAMNKNVIGEIFKYLSAQRSSRP